MESDIWKYTYILSWNNIRFQQNRQAHFGCISLEKGKELNYWMLLNHNAIFNWQDKLCISVSFSPVWAIKYTVRLFPYYNSLGSRSYNRKEISLAKFYSQLQTYYGIVSGMPRIQPKAELCLTLWFLNFCALLNRTQQHHCFHFFPPSLLASISWRVKAYSLNTEIDPRWVT